MSSSLREQKRRATLAAIEESATALVEEHGYDTVTVEDICAAAQISRRTFFNYVDSKETAVMGQPPRELTDEAVSEFLQSPHDDLFLAVLQLCFLVLPESATAGSGLSKVVERRKAIKRDHPELAYARLHTFTASHAQIHRAVEDYLARYPEQRRLEIPIEQEAQLVVSVAVQSLQMGYKYWISAGPDANSVEVHSENALSLFRQLFREGR
ncbi:TetR/AcrR family transcriptional regulator [Corynebacterium epidermidicanis]|uniref:Transcriptional regulator, TetR family n=1 Tax=Corynebacterium epidermidicanis TaxID=1050174 RepID=A0A0G3GVA4_9CORY|nr:TetR/AcrR family transcriptional regulator [Corynebacterium epidermidicanis]AKK02762.1 transcriptional regulator, TetR family [Corynebacterium epidermidicanis]